MLRDALAAGLWSSAGRREEQSAWARIQRKPSNLPGQNPTSQGLRASLGFFFPPVKPNEHTVGWLKDTLGEAGSV